MGKLIHSFRFRADDELHDWIEEQSMIEDLPSHLVIRRTMREAMKRQREFNRKCNEGFLSVGESKPGLKRSREDSEGHERKRA